MPNPQTSILFGSPDVLALCTSSLFSLACLNANLLQSGFSISISLPLLFCAHSPGLSQMRQLQCAGRTFFVITANFFFLQFSMNNYGFKDSNSSNGMFHWLLSNNKSNILMCKADLSFNLITSMKPPCHSGPSPPSCHPLRTLLSVLPSTQCVPLASLFYIR